jgi:hypothetical protein
MLTYDTMGRIRMSHWYFKFGTHPRAWALKIRTFSNKKRINYTTCSPKLVAIRQQLEIHTNYAVPLYETRYMTLSLFKFSTTRRNSHKWPIASSPGNYSVTMKSNDLSVSYKIPWYWRQTRSRWTLESILRTPFTDRNGNVIQVQDQ